MTRKALRFIPPRRFTPRLLCLTTAAVLAAPISAYAVVPWHSDGRVPATIVKKDRTRGADGVSFTIPEPYGTQMSYEANTTEGNVFGPWAAGTRQRLVWEAWMAKGHAYDNGISTIDGYYLVACTRAFGVPGDRVDFELENGTVIHCIVGDTKNLMDEDCNVFGHANGACVCEWLVDPTAPGPRSGLGGPGHEGWLPEWSGRVVKATNYGLWDGFPFSDETVSSFVDTSIDATAWCETAMLMASQKDTGYLLGAQHDSKPYDPALGIDCSSFVRHALILSGAFTDDEIEPFSTYEEERVLTGLGFEMHPLTDPDELEPGDILWCSGHTEIYIGKDVIKDAEGNVIPGHVRIGAHYDYDGKSGDGNQDVDGDWLGDGSDEVGASFGVSSRFTHYFRSTVANRSWLGLGSILASKPQPRVYADGTRVVDYSYFPGHEPARVVPGPDVWDDDLSYGSGQTGWSYDPNDYDEGDYGTAPVIPPVAPEGEATAPEAPAEDPVAPDAPDEAVPGTESAVPPADDPSAPETGDPGTPGTDDPVIGTEDVGFDISDAVVAPEGEPRPEESAPVEGEMTGQPDEGEHFLSEPPVIEDPNAEVDLYASDDGNFDEWNGYENGYADGELYSHGNEDHEDWYSYDGGSQDAESYIFDDEHYELAPAVPLYDTSEPYVEPTGGAEVAPTTD